LVLACRFWVLTAAGYKRHEVAKMLEASPAAMRSAQARIERAVSRLDAGD
jgi:hypothetical protein